MRNIEMKVDLDSLAHSIAGLHNDDIFEFINKIHNSTCDANLSARLIRDLCEALKDDAEELDLKFIDWSKV